MVFRFSAEGCSSSSNLLGSLLHRIATFILTTAAVLLSIDGGKVGHCAAQRSVPNVVIILSDDLGYGDIGCYGATRVKTPQPRPAGPARPALHRRATRRRLPARRPAMP